MLELSCNVTILCEYGDTITVWVAVDEVDGFLSILGSHNHHHWSKDFFSVA